MVISIDPSTGPSPSAPTTISTSPDPVQPLKSEDRDPSPEPPPASPLTPVAHPVKPAKPQEFIQQPPPSLPFSGDDSSDAIALRAAISSLQFQRLQAQRDLRTLEDVKRLAVEHPEEYRRHVIRTATAKPAPPPWKDTENDKSHDEDTVAGAVSPKAHHVPSGQDAPEASSVSYGSMLHRQESNTSQQNLKFPDVPKPQDVVRCPPIEWAKYNIVGESLDKLHRDQQERPGDFGSSQRDSVIAAPYNPFVDQLDSQPSPAVNTTRKDSGSSATGQTIQKRRSSKTDA